MTKPEPELWQRSSLDTREQYEAAVIELRRLIDSYPAAGTEARDELTALHVLCANYEADQLEKR